MTIDLMASAALQLATITAAVWSLTEVLGRTTGWRKDYLGLVLGPLAGLVAWALGFLSGLPDCPGVHPLICKPAGGLFAGLVATLTAKWFHDLVAGPIMERLRGAVPPPPPPTGGPA